MPQKRLLCSTSPRSRGWTPIFRLALAMTSRRNECVPGNGSSGRSQTSRGPRLEVPFPSSCSLMLSRRFAARSCCTADSQLCQLYQLYPRHHHATLSTLGAGRCGWAEGVLHPRGARLPPRALSRERKASEAGSSTAPMPRHGRGGESCERTLAGYLIFTGISPWDGPPFRHFRC